MNRALKVAPDPVVELNPVDSAKAEIAEIMGERNRIAEAQREVESAPDDPRAGQAQSLRQRIGRLLMLGRGNPTPEVDALSDELVDAERAEKRAAMIAAAKAELVADLAAQENALRPKLNAAQQRLAVARFDAAAAEIQGKLVPDLRVAASQFAAAYGRLIGAGRAHNAMAQRLRDKGMACQPLGVENPATSVSVTVLGFGFDDHGVNRLILDAAGASEVARVEFMGKWS